MMLCCLPIGCVAVCADHAAAADVVGCVGGAADADADTDTDWCGSAQRVHVGMRGGAARLGL